MFGHNHTTFRIKSIVVRKFLASSLQLGLASLPLSASTARIPTALTFRTGGRGGGIEAGLCYLRAELRLEPSATKGPIGAETLASSVRIRNRDPVPFWPLGKISGIRIRDEQPGSYFRELRSNFLGLNNLNSLMRIRNPGWKKFGSRINIADPQHCLLGNILNYMWYNCLMCSPPPGGWQ